MAFKAKVDLAPAFAALTGKQIEIYIAPADFGDDTVRSMINDTDADTTILRHKSFGTTDRRPFYKGSMYGRVQDCGGAHILGRWPTYYRIFPNSRAFN